MKVYDTKDIRNIALIGNSASGKTILSEAMIATAGVTNRMGTIEAGTTKSDYTEDEIHHKVSITSTLLQFEWQGCKLNLIDTPGSADFVGDVIAGLRAVDNVALTVDAVTGLEVGTENAWEHAEKDDKPLFFVVTRVGKENAKATDIQKAIQDRFGIRALPIQIPVNPGVGFNSLVDIVTMKQHTYDLNGSGKGATADIPAGLKDQAEELHEKLIEAAAESDDTLMEKFFESGLTTEEVSSGIKKAILTRTLYPILFTDGESNVGADLFIKHIADSAQSPADMPPIRAAKGDGEIELIPSNDAPLSMIVFKTLIEPHVGELSIFRCYSGSFKSGDEIFNSSHNTAEKPTLIYSLLGHDKAEVPQVMAGDIGTFVKMKITRTGDSLCSKQMQFKLPPIVYPAPVMDVAVYPAVKGDEDKIMQGILKLHEEDPSFVIHNNPELRQIILEAQGGTQVDIILERFKRKYAVDVELKAPKIPYRETITGKSDEHYRYKKQTGGRGQYGDVHLRMEPTPRGDGYEFANEIKGGVIPGRFIPAVEKGLVEAMERGPLTKSQVIDLKIALYYGSFHAVDSSELAFKLAASMCFKECFMKAHPILLEPIYSIEVRVPDTYTGDVMGDLSSRRGKIQGMEPVGVFQVVKAQVPLAELYLYSTHLRSLTNGRGSYKRNFSHYETVPPDIAKKVVEAHATPEEE